MFQKGDTPLLIRTVYNHRPLDCRTPVVFKLLSDYNQPNQPEDSLSCTRMFLMRKSGFESCLLTLPARERLKRMLFRPVLCVEIPSTLGLVQTSRFSCAELYSVKNDT